MSDKDSKIAVILIAYPQIFTCYEKFQRKISRLTSNMSKYRLAYKSDSREFIKRYSSEDSRCIETIQVPLSEWYKGASHAIIFNAHGEFDEDIEQLKSLTLKLRVVSLSLTKVVNIDKKDLHDVYIGRGSVWGNPYAIGFDGDRDEVIRKYAYDFNKGFLKFNKNDVLSLRGKRLGCHCKPFSCHGDILADFVNSQDDGS